MESSQAAPGRGRGDGASELAIGSQLFTYFLSDFSVSELVYLHGDPGHDIFEPYFLDDPDAIATAMEETGVEMPTAHAGGVQDDVPGTVDTYERFDTEVLVLPSGGDWDSEASITEWAETVNDLADAVQDASNGAMTVGYHNHDHEFETFDGTFGYDIFANHLDDVHLQVDVAWAWVGGANPVALLNRHADKIGSLHMKDAVMTDDGAELVEIGEGDVNLKAIANVARGAADVNYLLYEYDGTPTPEESVYHSGEFLETWNGPRHRNWYGQ